MNKLKEILLFIKNNLNGKNTHIFIISVAVLLLFKIFGFLGLVVGLVLSIGIDVCQTINLKVIYEFFSSKFFPIFILAILLTACATQKKPTYTVSEMLQLSKDTITSTEYNKMVLLKQYPPLKLFSKSYLKNEEERKTYTFYVYYDSISGKLFNVKELIYNKDTAYVVERKYMK